MEIYSKALLNNCVAAVEDENHASKLKSALNIAGVLEYWTIVILGKGSLPRIQTIEQNTIPNKSSYEDRNENIRKNCKRKKIQEVDQEIQDNNECSILKRRKDNECSVIIKEDSEVEGGFEDLPEEPIEYIIEEETPPELEYETIVEIEEDPEIDSTVNMEEPNGEVNEEVIEEIFEEIDYQKEYIQKPSINPEPRDFTEKRMETRKYLCEFCSVSFKDHRVLKKHIKNFHGEGILNCKFCGTIFTTVNGLKAHLKSCKNSCNSCGFQFENQAQLKLHLNADEKCKLTDNSSLSGRNSS